MRTWTQHQDGEHTDENGNCYYYDHSDAVGTIYALHTSIDGKRCTLFVGVADGDRVQDRINKMLDKIEAGWIPVNW